MLQAGLGNTSVLVEKYIIDPFDRTRPAPSATYSATSKLFNTDIIGLANNEKYFGYLVKGAKLTGKSSGAVATVTSIDLFSDNWGDLLVHSSLEMQIQHQNHLLYLLQELKHLK